MAVTKAQIDAGRKANAAYKAAQSSGNTAAAKSVFSNAASSLGVSGSAANNIYKNRSTTPTPTATVAKPAPIATPRTTTMTSPTPYTLPKGGFGDVRAGETGRNNFSGTGYGLSTGDNITDLSNFGGLGTAGKDYDKFGKSAEIMERNTPGFLAKRNDAYIMELASRTPDFNKLDELAQKEQIRNLLKERDTQGELFTGQRGDIDVQNTVDSIYARIGKGGENIQGQTPYNQAEAAYDREIADIESQYKAETDKFMRAGAIEDRYTNFNEVNNNIQDTLKVAGEHRAENLYTGTPTDEQIVEIAERSGNDFATTKKILEGRGYEDLEMQGEFKDKSEQSFIRDQENMEIDRQRNIENTNIAHERTQTAINEQIDDTKMMMERELAIGEKAGALSGAVRSSGYMQGLDNIRNDALRQIGRLETRADRDTADTAMMKSRITDDFELGMTRNKEDLVSAMNQIKTQNGSAIGQYLMEYAPSSEELTRKLNELNDKFALESQAAFGKYQENLRSITDTLTYDTEKMLDLQTTQQNLQQTNVANMLKDNGAALASMTYNQLGEMLKSGDISPVDYSTMSGYMQTLGVSALQSAGIPQPQDLQLYNSLLEQGATPMQALNTVKASAPLRFTQTAEAGGDWQPAEGGGYYRTAANGQLEFSDAPSTTTSPSSTYNVPDYTPADTSAMQEGQVFLYENGVDSYGGQCGSYVNDYLQSMGIDRLFIDPISAKSAVKNSDVPTVGGVAIIDWSNNPNATNAQKKYGHVAVIKSVNDDGTLTLQDSNHGGDEKVHERNISADKVTGYFDPTKGKETVQTPILDGETQVAKTYDSYDIQTFNQGDSKDKDADREFKNYQASLYQNPDSDILEVMKVSDGQGKVESSFIQNYNKAGVVANQLKALNEAINKGEVKTAAVYNEDGDLIQEATTIDMSPIFGWFKQKNPWSADAKEVQAILQGTVPNLARGIYGEVGVLTDTDINNYIKTLPNLRSTDQVKDLVMAATLKTVMYGVEAQMRNLAGSDRDVSGLTATYKQIQEKVASIEKSLGINTDEGTQTEVGTESKGGSISKIRN